MHELTGAVVPYVALKEVAHGMVCLSESRRGLNFRDVISAYCLQTVEFHLFYLRRDAVARSLVALRLVNDFAR